MNIIEFKNGSYLEIIPSDANAKPSVIHMQGFYLPYDDLYWYQKVLISLLLKGQKLKEKLAAPTQEKCTCIYCGKEFKDKSYYTIPRSSGNTIRENIKLARSLCCSDKCLFRALSAAEEVLSQEEKE